MIDEAANKGYIFEKMVDGKWTAIRTGSSSAIVAGGVNRITVRAERTHYQFGINNKYVAEADDDQFTGGSSGLAIGAGGRAVSDTTMEFSTFEMYEPPSP